MRLRYLVVDPRGQLRRVSQSVVEGLWEGQHRADALGCPCGNELRLVSVVLDDTLLPRRIYLLRLPLTDGRFTPENYLTLQLFTMPDCVTTKEVIQHHAAGWPANFFQQLALILDVPLADLPVPVRVGGPLFMAAALRLTPHQALRYFH
jgi:hypothetical protein